MAPFHCRLSQTINHITCFPRLVANFKYFEELTNVLGIADDVLVVMTFGHTMTECYAEY